MVPTLSITHSPLRRFHLAFVPLVLLSPFLDGYIFSVIGVGIGPITNQLGLGPVWQGLLGSSALIGVFIGSLLGGWAADRFGRALLFRFDLALLVLASIGMLWVQDPAGLFVLRVLAGIATGCSYPVAATLLTEYLPEKYRGSLLSLLTIAWFGGAMTAYLLGDWLVQFGPDGWRWAFAFAALPGMVALIGRFRMPESARWLVQRGRTAEAEAVVQKLYGSEYGLTGMSAGTDARSGLGEIVRTGYLGRLMYVGLFWGCSIVPLSAIYAFGPILLSDMGLDNAAASNASVMLNVMFFIGCIAWALFMNRARRRMVVIFSFAISGVALLLLGILPASPVWFIILLLAIYAASICGSQILQMLYPNEIFPTSIRASAVGIASASSRVFSIIGTFFVPQVLAIWGVGATFVVAAVVSFIALIASMLWAPETRGSATV